MTKPHQTRDRMSGVGLTWDSVPDAALYRLVHAADGRKYFEFVSAGFESLFELPEGVILEDAAPLYGLLHPADRDEAMRAQARAMETVSPFRHECRFNLPSGKTRWIRWHSMPEPLPDGGMVWDGMAIDVTGRREAEAALRELNATLEQRVAERTAEVEQHARRLAGLATELTLVEQRERRRMADFLHDHLQQLLVGARMQVHALSTTVPPSRQPALDKLGTTLTQAVEAARTVSRQIAPPVAVSGHLPEAFQWLVREVREAHRLEVNAVFRGGLTDLPEAESILLFTAARELLLNVVKHSGVLQAGLTLARAAGMVVLEVCDTGCGIGPEDLASPGSRGFGLFSIRERSESMGGGLRIDTGPGRGTRVTMSLPSAFAPVPGTRHVPEASRKGTGVVGPGRCEVPAVDGRILVLFVDDHQIVRESLVSLLNSQAGIEVVCQCGNGRQAVERAGELHPDVVVMDVSMPVMDGVEATRIIKERWPGIKVVGLSMYDEADGGDKMYAVGADAYLAKTAPPEELIKAIRRCGRAPTADEATTDCAGVSRTGRSA